MMPPITLRERLRRHPRTAFTLSLAVLTTNIAATDGSYFPPPPGPYLSGAYQTPTTPPRAAPLAPPGDSAPRQPLLPENDWHDANPYGATNLFGTQPAQPATTPARQPVMSWQPSAPAFAPTDTSTEAFATPRSSLSNGGGLPVFRPADPYGN